MARLVPQSGRTLSLLVWLAVVVAALGIGLAGAMKFVQRARWEGLFLSWGYPGSFSVIVGIIEILGAVALLVPRLSAYAASVLGVMMAGALLTLVTHPAGPLGRGMTPAFYLALLVFVGLQRWPIAFAIRAVRG